MIRQTEDPDEVCNVLCHPDIYYRLGEDGQPDPSDWIPPKDAIYLTNEDNTAVMVYHWVTNVCLECHVQVLPEARAKALEFGQEALQWAWDNTEASKIIAQIPEIYPDVLKFALKNGFSIEGLNEDSYLKNGQIISQLNVGIKRPQ